MKSVQIQKQTIKLYIWDTAGSEKYRSIVSTYFKGCNGVMMIFDLSRFALSNLDKKPTQASLTSGFQ